MDDKNIKTVCPSKEVLDTANYKERKDWPKISIITPSYNQGNYIEQTIQSVLNQDYKNIELIIIDGGSTDNTIEIIKKYENEIAFWVSEPDNGQAHAINKGFQHATGDILGWINSDDYYLEGYLKRVADIFKKKSNIEIVYGNSITVDDRTNISYVEYGKFLIDSFLVFGGVIFSHTAFWKKEISVELDERLHCALDYELWMRLFKGKKYEHLNYFGAVFRLQMESKSMQANNAFKQKWENDYLLIKEKHQLRDSYIYFSRLYHYTNFFYSLWCSLKYLKTDLNKKR